MIKESLKFKDSTVFEGMTSIRSILRGIESGNNNRQIVNVMYDKAKMSKIAKDVGYLKAVSEKFGYNVSESNAEEIDKMTLGNSHGGIVAIASERDIPVLSGDENIETNGFYCMIQGIEDPYNFGYALRSLYACGCSGIVLSERNWMSAAGVVARSSAGASERFKLYRSNPMDAIKAFKNKGYAVVCAHEKTDNILGKCSLPLPLFLIIGGEKRGISQDIVDSSDILVKINYAREFRASLSAASAATIFAYEIARQNF